MTFSGALKREPFNLGKFTLLIFWLQIEEKRAKILAIKGRLKWTVKWIFWPNKNGDIEMAFTDSLLKSILQKTIEIEKWAILERGTKLPRKELNFYDILDELRNEGKDGYAKELEKTRDELLGELQELPTFTSSQTAFGLFKKLRRIVEDRTDDSKKLLLYADSINDLVKDDTKLYPQIWRGEFEKLLDIVVAHLDGYDLWGELLSRIKEKSPTAAAQLKAQYQQLKEVANVQNAQDKELKAIQSAASTFVSLMKKVAKQISKPVKEPAETEQQAAAGKWGKIRAWVKRHPHGYGLTGGFVFLILFFVLGLFKAQWRDWCWGTAGIALLVLILSLLGGRSFR